MRAGAAGIAALQSPFRGRGIHGCCWPAAADGPVRCTPSAIGVSVTLPLTGCPKRTQGWPPLAWPRFAPGGAVVAGSGAVPQAARKVAVAMAIKAMRMACSNDELREPYPHCGSDAMKQSDR